MAERTKFRCAVLCCGVVWCVCVFVGWRRDTTIRPAPGCCWFRHCLHCLQGVPAVHHLHLCLHLSGGGALGVEPQRLAVGAPQVRPVSGAAAACPQIPRAAHAPACLSAFPAGQPPVFFSTLHPTPNASQPHARPCPPQARLQLRPEGAAHQRYHGPHGLCRLWRGAHGGGLGGAGGGHHAGPPPGPIHKGGSKGGQGWEQGWEGWLAAAWKRCCWVALQRCLQQQLLPAAPQPRACRPLLPPRRRGVHCERRA